MNYWPLFRCTTPVTDWLLFILRDLLLLWILLLLFLPAVPVYFLPFGWSISHDLMFLWFIYVGMVLTH